MLEFSESIRYHEKIEKFCYKYKRKCLRQDGIIKLSFSMTYIILEKTQKYFLAEIFAFEIQESEKLSITTSVKSLSLLKRILSLPLA